MALLAKARIRGAHGSVLVALAAAPCLSACGSSERSVDSTKVQRAISISIEKERGIDARVACPRRIPLEQGRVFTCSAQLEVGSYPVTVTEVSSDGQVRYRSAEPLVALDVLKVQRSIESSIAAQRHVSATVRCPAQVLQRARIEFRCGAAIAGSARTYAFIVTELDNRGHVRYVGI